MPIPICYMPLQTNLDLIIGTGSATSTLTSSGGNLGLGTTSPFGLFSVNNTGTIIAAAATFSTSTTFTIDWRQSHQPEVILGNGAQTINFSNYIAGQTLRIVACQNEAGSGTVTWDTNVFWDGGSAPTLTTTAKKCDVLSFLATNATSTGIETAATSTIIFGSSVLNFGQ